MNWIPPFLEFMRSVESGDAESILLACQARDKVMRRFEAENVENLPVYKNLLTIKLAAIADNPTSLETLDLIPQMCLGKDDAVLKRLRNTGHSDWAALIIAVTVFEPWQIPNLRFHLRENSEDFPLFLALIMRRRVVTRTQSEFKKFERVALICFELFEAIFTDSNQATRVKLFNAMRSVINTGFVYSADFSLTKYQKAKAKVVELMATFESGVDIIWQDRGRFASVRSLVVFDTDVDSTENLTAVKFVERLASSSQELLCVVLTSRQKDGVVRHALERLTTIVERPKGGVAALVELVRGLKVDTAFYANNLSFGYSELIALAAHQVARNSYANYACVTTTGLRAIDRFVSGKASEPKLAPRHYRERLELFPGSGLIFSGIDQKIEACVKREREIYRRSNRKHVRFVVGANVFKCSPTFTEALVQILKSVPRARCVLYPYNPNWKPNYPAKTKFRARLFSQARQAGVNPNRFVIVGPYDSADDIFKPLLQSDIFLDSFPHSGGLSTLDGLIAGLPVVALRGRFQRSMQGADAITQAKCVNSVIAENVSDYRVAAIRLANGLGENPVSSRCTSASGDLAGLFQGELGWKPPIVGKPTSAENIS